MYIDVSNVSISFEESKEQHTILNDVSLQVEKGEFICLLGPSGCGKSTLLNAMAGFLKPSSGEIKINGQTVEKPSMKYVTIFQNYGLLPWRSVQKNVELGLETKKLGKEEKKKITDHYLEMVGLKEAAFWRVSPPVFRRYEAEGGNRQSTGGRAGNPVYG